MVTVINNVNFHLWEAHKDDFFSVPEDNPLEELIQTAEEFANPDSDPEQAAMIFICKRLRLNYRKLTDEEKKALKKIAEVGLAEKSRSALGTDKKIKKATNRNRGILQWST